MNNLNGNVVDSVPITLVPSLPCFDTKSSGGFSRLKKTLKRRVQMGELDQYITLQVFQVNALANLAQREARDDVHCFLVCNKFPDTIRAHDQKNIGALHNVVHRYVGLRGDTDGMTCAISK